MELAIPDMLDLIFFWLIEHRSEEDMQEFERTLTTPPVGVAPSEDDPFWSAAAEMSMFMALMGDNGEMTFSE